MTENTTPAIDSPEAQRITRDYLEGRILLCVSTAVHQMIQVEELREEWEMRDLTQGPIDLEGFAEAAMDDMMAEEIAHAAYDFTEYRGPTDEDEAKTRGEWEDQERIARRCIIADLNENADNQELIDALENASGIDPNEYMSEVFEFYAVAEWFGRQLAQAGEKVTDFMGWSVWSRTTTGQAIYLDEVVQNIALDAHS